MSKFFCQMALQSQEMSQIVAMIKILVQEEDAGSLESKINDLKVDA